MFSRAAFHIVTLVQFVTMLETSHYAGSIVAFKDQPFIVAGRDTLIAETLVTLADGLGS